MRLTQGNLLPRRLPDARLGSPIHEELSKCRPTTSRFVGFCRLVGRTSARLGQSPLAAAERGFAPMIEADWADELFNGRRPRGCRRCGGCDRRTLPLRRHTGRVLDRARGLPSAANEAFAANLADMRAGRRASRRRSPWRRQEDSYQRAAAPRLAFTNHRSDFDRICSSSGTLGRRSRMCDQYGCNAPGGGLFVLEDPFAASRVNMPRGGGRERPPGRRRLRCAPSPEVSSMARRYSPSASAGHETYQWGPEISYHLPRADGSDSRIDGRPWNGSTRAPPTADRLVPARDGYLRCGRRPVTRPLDGPDGSDIICFSYGTHEWRRA